MSIIKRVIPEWSEDFDNSASFQVLLDVRAKDYVYTETDGHYFAVSGACVSMFAYRQPGEGYGGRVFPVTMQDGSTRELKGPWSSSAGASNSYHPDQVCVDCSITDDEQVLARGHTFYAGHVLIAPLVEWWLEHRSELEWGIYLMADGTIQPSKGRFVKNSHVGYLSRLLPSKLSSEEFAQYLPAHRKYFMDKVTEFWQRQRPRYDELSGEQRAVVGA